jgi:DNA-binding response OmpR family regulator
VRLLVIEDDDAIRDVLERGLRADGFTVDSYADGASGLWRGIDGGYAAIILDLLLPGMSGYRVCEQLRAEGIATPILVLTAKSGELDQIDLLDMGADDFLTKPVSIAVLGASA